MKTNRYADENARPFDPQWETDLPSLKHYLAGLADSLQEDEIASPDVKRDRRRKGPKLQKYRDAVQAILLDLFRAHLSDPCLEVGISARKGTVQEMCSGQYGARFLSARTFEDAFNSLKRSGSIVMTTEFWDDPSGKESRVRRFQASPKLLDTLREFGASAVTLKRRENAEGIILKEKKDKKTSKKPLVNYGDVHFANEARDRLQDINQMLLEHWADVALSDQEIQHKLREVAKLQDKNPARLPDFAARTVYRVFNNKDWEQGGRFYGAWWMSCPSVLRPYILLDGKRTVEVDYSGLHAAMLFAEINEDIPPDPYARCVTHTGRDEERKLVKLTFNALLNADSVSQLGEVKGYRKDITGRDWNDFKQYIVNSFPEFKQHIASGAGLRLQRKDSDLAETVMLKFASKGDACLPVHDSFIVHHGMQDVLTNTMKGAFEDEFGSVGETDFELGVGVTVRGTGEFIELNPEELLNPSGYEGRLQAFYAMRQ